MQHSADSEPYRHGHFHIEPRHAAAHRHESGGTPLDVLAWIALGMRRQHLRSWATTPSFAAIGIVLAGAEDAEASFLVLVEGRALHRPTGLTFGPGDALCFDAGEPWDLEVLEDLTYWDTSFLPSGP